MKQELLSRKIEHKRVCLWKQSKTTLITEI